MLQLFSVDMCSELNIQHWEFEQCREDTVTPAPLILQSEKYMWALTEDGVGEKVKERAWYKRSEKSQEYVRERERVRER